MKTPTSLYILLKRENSGYFLLQRVPAGTHYLEYFLTSDVRIRVESFIKEFEEDQEYGAALKGMLTIMENRYSLNMSTFIQFIRLQKLSNCISL